MQIYPKTTETFYNVS